MIKSWNTILYVNLMIDEMSDPIHLQLYLHNNPDIKEKVITSGLDDPQKQGHEGKHDGGHDKLTFKNISEK